MNRVKTSADNTEEHHKKKSDQTFSLQQLLKQKTQQVIGAIQGHMPIFDTKEQSKPYVDTLRGLAG